jgi:hypothetical protein
MKRIDEALSEPLIDHPGKPPLNKIKMLIRKLLKLNSKQ